MLRHDRVRPDFRCPPRDGARVGAERILWGTDNPFIARARPGRVLLRVSQMDEEAPDSGAERERIFKL